MWVTTDPQTSENPGPKDGRGAIGERNLAKRQNIDHLTFFILHLGYDNHISNRRNWIFKISKLKIQ
jgi:hypothetical protein